MNINNLTDRLEALRKAGKSAEVDQIEKGLSKLLEEANNIPINLVIEIDMGPLPFTRDFTKGGFHLEKSRQSGKVKFEVVPVIKDGESPVGGHEMLKRAKAAGCCMDQEQGDRVAAFLNSKDGKEASDALQGSGCHYIILPNEDDLWVDGSSGCRYVPVLNLGGQRWLSGLNSLDYVFGPLGRFLVPCKPAAGKP